MEMTSLFLITQILHAVKILRKFKLAMIPFIANILGSYFQSYFCASEHRGFTQIGSYVITVLYNTPF